MKNRYLISVFFLTCLISILITSCTESIDKQMRATELEFIKNRTIMTKKDALSKEIDYYKDPEITNRRHTRSLTGKELIHECNKIMKEDEEHIERDGYGIKRKAYDIKEYAIQNPDQIIANEFVFSGVFTHYGEDKYEKYTESIIYIPKLNRFLSTSLKFGRLLD